MCFFVTEQQSHQGTEKIPIRSMEINTAPYLTEITVLPQYKQQGI